MWIRLISKDWHTSLTKILYWSYVECFMECYHNCHLLLPGPCLLGAGFILYVVGLSSTYWSERSGAHVGLWKVCTTDNKNDELCFTINERGSVPPMVFLCSFFCILSIIIIGLSVLTSLLTLCQKKSSMITWSKNSATASLIAVVLSVCAECIYGATYFIISYDNIPNWTVISTGNKLAWSFYLTCVSTLLVLVGSVYLIVTPQYILSTNKVSSTMPQIPILQIHPPPSDRTPTPLYLLSQRSSSPLPSPFTTKGSHLHHQSLPPVFTQLRR